MIARVPPRVLDAALAAILCVASVASVLTSSADANAAVAVAFSAVSTVPLVWRRRAPLLVAVWILPALVAGAAVSDRYLNNTTGFVVALLLAYTLGAQLERREALAGLALSVVAAVAVEAVQPARTASDFIFPPAFMAIAWTAGRAVRERTRLVAELHEADRLAADARTQEAAAAVAEERRRIARDMHDVVAHSLSVMVVQAGGARRILDRDPDRAAQAAQQIEAAGRAALAELRRVLGVLEAAGAPAARAPQPSLRDVETLVREARAAGLAVSLRVSGTPRPLAPDLELTAYRVVQEALTNARKHAGAARTQVTVRWEEEWLEVAVVDAGGAGPGGGTGHGLVGMRERVALSGGELSAGPRPGGGFAVRARLPLARESVAA
jgi:signal transduction histidine kinase